MLTPPQPSLPPPTTSSHFTKHLQAVLTRGWLIVSPSQPTTHQHVTHAVHWTTVASQPGPRMYSGPSRPVKQQCWAQGTRGAAAAKAGLAWLSVPVSR